MFTALVLGSVIAFITMGIQVAVVVLMVRYLIRVMARRDRHLESWMFDTYVISSILLMLFAGHLFQIAIWAVVFVELGEFSDFVPAFYHSAVNFASLGYGDIVMSEEWRLLGALEASNGVLMFGLSAGTLLSVMVRLFAGHTIGGVKPEDRGHM
jgi:hypothetical protein